MNKRPREADTWQFAGVLTTALLASVGLVLTSLSAIISRNEAPSRSWGVTWGGYFSLLLLAALIGTHSAVYPFVAGLLPVTILATWAYQPNRKVTFNALLVALVLLLSLLALEHYLGAYTWQPSTFSSLSKTIEQLTTGKLQSPGGQRAWRVENATGTESLSFDARRLTSPSSNYWDRSTAAIDLSHPGEVTRASFPSRGDPYLMRTYPLDDRVGGRTFRATVTMRSSLDEPVRGGIWIQAWGPGGSAGPLRVEVGNKWRTYQHSWTAPAAATDTLIRLILNNFDGSTIEISEAHLEVLAESGEWLDLGPPIGSGAALTLSWAGEPTSARQPLSLTTDWRAYVIDVPELPDSADGPLRLRASLGLQEGVELQMRNVELVPGDGSSIEPVQSITRRSLWFSYPNLAGHVLLLVALTLVSLTPSIRLGLLIAVIAMGGVASTQSATALVAGLVGLPLLLVLKVKGASPKRILLIAIPVLYLLGFAGAVVFAPQLVESVLESPGLTRVQIWRTAWKGFLAHPLTGVGFGGEEFSDYFASAYPRNLPDAIPNAHNLWLTHASELGVAGLLASLWLTGGLLILGWNWGRWHGIAFLLPVFILNTLDYSFFSWWILFLVILGLNLMRGSAEPQPHIQR